MGLVKSLLFSARTTKIAGRAIDLNAQQTAISATNISNAETPNYKASKFEFESVLQDAVSVNTLPMVTTNGKHILGQLQDVKSIKGITDVDLSPGRLDGNNVDLDRETVTFTQAQISYSALIAAMGSRGQTNRSAVTDAK
jgi:flagellar basal-body rod protein FlgB